MNWAIKKPMENSGIENVKNAGCLFSTENIIIIGANINGSMKVTENSN
jgi:hypothetical protein